MAALVRKRTVALLTTLFLMSFALTVAASLGAHTESLLPMPAGAVHSDASPFLFSETPKNNTAIGTKTPLIAVGYADLTPGAVIVGVSFFLDGMNLTSAGTFNNTLFSLPLALELRDGPHLANFAVVDSFRAVGFENWTFLVDSDTPQIALTSPLVPITNRSTVVVSGYASDTMVVAVLVNFNSVPFNATSGFFTTTLANLPDGVNPILVTAVDAAQHRGNAKTAVVVDTTAPVVKVLYPLDGLETNQSTIVVSGTVDDVNATVIVNGQEVHPDADGTWRTTVAIVVGANAIAVSAVDPTGNRAPAVTRTVTYYAPWPGLDKTISDNQHAFSVWGSWMSLGLAAILIVLLGVVLAMYVRFNARVLRLRGTRPEKLPGQAVQESEEKTPEK